MGKKANRALALEALRLLRTLGEARASGSDVRGLLGTFGSTVVPKLMEAVGGKGGSKSLVVEVAAGESVDLVVNGTRLRVVGKPSKDKVAGEASAEGVAGSGAESAAAGASAQECREEGSAEASAPSLAAGLAGLSKAVSEVTDGRVNLAGVPGGLASLLKAAAEGLEKAASKDADPPQGK